MTTEKQINVISKKVIPILIYKIFWISFTKINGLLHLAYLKIFINLLKRKNVGKKQFLSRILDYINTDVYCLGCKMLQPFFRGFWQRCWRNLLANWSYYIYIDDILIYGKTFWQHMVNLAQVFQALTEAHLRVKIEKMLSSDFSWILQLLPEIYQGFLKDC